MEIIGAEDVARRLNWPRLVEALRDGHRLPPAKAEDMLLAPGENRMLVRSAWIEGLGGGLKAVTIYPENPGKTPPLPAVQGQFLLFDEARGDVVAVIEGAAITAWKTAADSALGADLLSRRDARVFAMVGAGAMAEPLIRAHHAVRPGIERILLWNRSPGKCEELKARLADLGTDVALAPVLSKAVGDADIVCTATMAKAPLIEGEWLRDGTHLDLVGAFTPEMREADDAALTRAFIFADLRATALDTGELADPIARGVISAEDVRGDLYDLVAGRAGRNSDTDITLYKNGGGAHLDLMTARAVVAGGVAQPGG